MPNVITHYQDRCKCYLFTYPKRSAKPFVTVDCGALPEALLEEELFGRRGGGAMTGRRAGKGGALEGAEGGTLFLDEVAEMPQALQAKLVSTLREREVTRVDGALVQVNVRILAATHRDLEAPQPGSASVKDLYRQLNVATIIMPPLRERGEDIMILAEYFASQSSRRARRAPPRIPREVRDRLLRYRWPGNVRELANVIERVVILGDGVEISLKDLPLEVRDAPGRDLRVFLAYSSLADRDRRAATKIAEFLKSRGYAVFDTPDIAADSALTNAILVRMRASIAVVVVYSADSADSAWLPRAVELTQKEKVALLPVAIGGMPWGIGINQRIANLNHVLWNESDAEGSLQTLKAALDGLGQPVAPRQAFPGVYISCAPEDRLLGRAINEHLAKHVSSVWLDDRNVPPRRRGEPSLEFLLKPGNLMIAIISELGARNEWLQEEVGMALEFRTRILPIRIGNLSSLPPPLDKLAHLPWVDAGSRTATPDILADIDRYVAAFQPDSTESADDIYIETAAARDARRSVLSGSSLIVSAPRRSGKSALLRYLQRALEAQHIPTQYIDLERESDFPSDPALLLDNVEDVTKMLGRLSRQQRQTHCVLATPAASGFGRSLVVELHDFTLDEVRELNRRFGSPLRPHQVEELFDLLDGHPYLTRAVITAAAQRLLVSIADVSSLQPIEEELHLLDYELGAGDLRRAWVGLLSGVRLDMQAQDRLLTLGLAKKHKGALVPRNRLFREFFGRPRRDLHTVLISTPDHDLPLARAVRRWLENHNTTVLEFDESVGPREPHDPQVEQVLDRADVVIGLIAEPFGGRGNLDEIQMAFERYRIEGRPKVFAVLVRRDGPPSELLSEIPFFRWDSDADTPGLLRELAALLGEDRPVVA
jgi:hypothetical protein